MSWTSVKIIKNIKVHWMINMFTFNTIGTWQSGRLGNQLFQVASIYSLSLDLNVDFKLPLYVKNHEHFNIDVMFNIDHLLSDVNADFIEYNEPSQCYVDIKSVIDPKSNINFNGFFQSEKYFENNRDAILNLFTIKSEIMSSSEKIYSFIKNKFPTDIIVSLHVRRDDYLKLSHKHVNLSMEYYKHAVKKLNQIIGDFKLIVFSDEIDWCKNNLFFDNIIFYSDNNCYVDLCLMSMFDHNIIANSTFSWWGAYLNKNKNKIVISPKKWFHLPFNNPDINPSDWISLQCI